MIANIIRWNIIRWITLFEVATSWACQRDDVVAEIGRSDTADECTETEPPVLLGREGVEECGGLIAAQTFGFAACICDDLVATGTLTADAYDSRNGPYVAGTFGGSLGINGRLASSREIDISGSLFIAGAGGIQTGLAPVSIQGRLFDQGPLRADGAVLVGGDASIGSSVRASSLEIGGVLTIPDADAIEVSGDLRAPSILEREVVVPPPCACETTVDIAAYVNRHHEVNDNARIGLGEDDLGNLEEATRLELPCGRYYVSRISGQGALTLAIEDRAALFVGQDLALQDMLTVELAPGAELDLFIAGQIVASNRLDLGDTSNAARIRIYMGGSGTLQLDAGATLAGYLYAPHAELSSNGDVELFGALFVRRLAVSGRFRAHYDLAIATAGDLCPEQVPESCEGCASCLNRACIDGRCISCTSDQECCAPRVCANGQCVPEI